MGKFGIKEAKSLIRLALETERIKEDIAAIFMNIRHILMQLGAEALAEKDIQEGQKPSEKNPVLCS
jgi:hypothetical protein